MSRGSQARSGGKLYCEQCGAKASATASFCGTCGTSLRQAADAVAQQSPRVQESNEAPKRCAVAICNEYREPSSDFCPWHGPNATKRPRRRSKPNMDSVEGAVDFGASPHLICPHCHTKGRVKTRKEYKATGISGAKASGAVITGGLSVFLTGLSRKEFKVVATCGACKSKWII